MVRHGHAAAAWAEDLDPGLDEAGQAQAEAAARTLVPHAPAQLLTSPLKRARETAAPLSKLLERGVAVETRVAEIPSPGMELAERGPWLRQVMQGNWSALAPELQAWRGELIECLEGIREDTAIFSHFIAINAAVGHVTGDDRVVNFRPDNGSITIFECGRDGLELIEQGAEARTFVG